MNDVRIIGGVYRSRKITFADLPGLRPTQDRIRETLFNWLAPYLSQATCLDLFAGSGVLGFEALSRGARFNCFVDQHPKVIHSLQENAKKLTIAAEYYAIIQAKVPMAMGLPSGPFDIVFLDPPFHQNLLTPTLSWLITANLLKPGALIYIEKENDLDLKLPEGWEIYRCKQTKTLTYQLITSTDPEQIPGNHPGIVM